MRHRFLRFAAAGLSLTTLVGLGLASPAAASPPTGYGFDNTAHVIVGGGSDTTYNAMNAITRLYDASLGCAVNTGDVVAPPVANTCVTNGSPETNTLGNYQRDSVVQANPVGSGTGLGSLNNFPVGVQYAGTANGGNVDFARSSREPVTAGPAFSGTKCNPGGVASDELQCDTFWGFGQDGVAVFAYNSTLAGSTARGTTVQTTATGITSNELFKIWSCAFTVWSDIPSLGISPGSPQDGPIVAWGMNPASGTLGTFNTHLVNFGGAPAGFSVDAGGCVHKLTTGIFPFENDIKPIFNDVNANGMLATTTQGAQPAGLNTANPLSPANPINWIWFSSGGVLASYPYTSIYPIGGNTYSAIASNINGIGYSTGSVLDQSYPIGRTLYHVTRKVDADCIVAAGAPAFERPCAFTANPGPAYPAHDGQVAGNDLNVTGGASGVSGGVREFTRFLCRIGVGQHSKDTLTGTSLFTELRAAVSADGFTAIPSNQPNPLKTPGSSCHVRS